MLTTQEALVSLATATAGAAVDSLRELAGDAVAAGPISVALPGRDPLADIATPAVIVTLAHAETGGGHVLVVPLGAAQRLAGAGDDAPADIPDDEVAALAAPLADALRAAARATRATLRMDPPVAEPEVRLARSARDIKLSFQGTTRTTLAALSLHGETCRLVQFVPPALTNRLNEIFGAESSEQDAGVRAALGSSLREVPLRVWAEVGRARLRTAEVAGLGDGAIVELDRAAEDPVDLYVNGSRIGTGRLICVDGKDWAVRLEEVFATAEPSPDL